MGYKNLQACIKDLETTNQLVRIKEEVDPNIEMAAIHLRVHEKGGPAILFENIKGCSFQAVSNLFGTMARSKFIFRDTFEDIQKLIEIKNDPLIALRNPLSLITGINAYAYKVSFNACDFLETSIDQLPLIKHWPDDGGAFITLPQVFTEDPDHPGNKKSNLGMYRIQLNGNDYELNKEIGLHYQLHRGIGIHQSKANAKGEALKVSIFVGGPPAHSVAAVMPLPEGMSELKFAGVLNNRMFRYCYKDGYLLSADADFIITGEVYPNENKAEGPFGDHLGYYSLKHDFPVMRVHKVYHKKNAIWPFTVVGRPPQEDTSFGALIHEMTGKALSYEIPGLHDVHAVDAAGVHPLLLTIGSERYTPYIKERKPQEILKIANHVLGTGQLSLAKYLFIATQEDDPSLNTKDIPKYLQHVLERVDWTRDLHFQTRTSIDTLDYSGTDLNSGSKVVIAAAGEKKRTLANELKGTFPLPDNFSNPKIILPGIIAITASKYETNGKAIEQLTQALPENLVDTFPLIVLSDDSNFTAANLNNFLWETFTRSNPSHDIHGVNAFTENKHWGCKGTVIIDARTKPHHAPPLIKDEAIEKRVDALGEKGKSLHGII